MLLRRLVAVADDVPRLPTGWTTIGHLRNGYESLSGGVVFTSRLNSACEYR